MKIGKKIVCQGCGASSLLRHETLSVLECEYCGGLMSFSDESTQITEDRHKPTKLTFLLIIIPVSVIVLMMVFWFVFTNIRKHRTLESYEVKMPVRVTSSTQTKKEPVVTTVEETSNSVSESLNDLITIQSQVSGETINGGQYWIFGIKNNNDQRVSRPGVMLSLFDQEGRRIEEQGGWSLRETLEPEEQTIVLLFLAKVPTDAVEQKLKPFASKPNQFGLKQVDVSVESFNVTSKNKLFEVVGDVVNEHGFNVRYVRLMAVAYDSHDKPIGMGNAFSTDKELAPQQRSGFKVKVGTFLQGEPVTWRVWALGRQ